MQRQSRALVSFLARQATRYSVASRRRKARVLDTLVRSTGVRTVLLVGVEAEPHEWSNIVERSLIDAASWTVGSGLGPSIGLGDCEVICDGRSLPFGAKTFDLVVSNAVVEHVGDAADQRTFIDEHHRVAKRFVVTTPNLLFPVESHTRVMFRHWSRSWRSQQSQHFTRLLTKRSFARLLPETGTSITGHWWSPTFTAVHMCERGCAS